MSVSCAHVVLWLLNMNQQAIL
uniref:Uncharacterized protein n=1 Tax=Anguilla anguilla TaxID=7936 RepID=A0A0E9TG79_ANGAN